MRRSFLTAFTMAPKIIPVILCGGSGTRLWPMSRRLLPKQFLPLISERSMLQETVLRAAALPQAQPPIIVSSDDHRFFAAQQLAEIGIQPGRIVLEPVARNTAPALAAAALAAGEADDAVLLVLPADHLIRDETAFAQAVKLGTRAAAAGAMVAFGIVPQSPETGYGYIEQGPALEQEGCFRVARFVEKPDLAKAKTFLAAGNFLWNSGMFMMTPRRYLEELGRYRPDILAGATAAWNQRRDETDFSRLDAASFGACPSDSIDYAVMERTRDAAVVPAEIGWSDVGSWATLWETAELDANGNAVRGDVDLHDTRNSYLRAESRLLSVNGLDNVVVVETNDAVLVTSRDKAQSVKDVVSRLAEGKRSEHLSHRRVYRPWGYYESIDNAAGFQVKRLMVSPGQAISLQLHHRRSEHWVVVSGRARVTRGDDLIYLDANQSTYIPLGMKHRLENPGQVPLYIIEVQSGDYLGEDDIVRFEDRYNRA